MFDSGRGSLYGGEGDGGPVSVIPPGPKLALNGPGRRHQHSEPYKKTGMTNVSNNFAFVQTVTFLDLQILFSWPVTADARPVLRFISAVIWASSDTSPPRYINSSTCSNTSLLYTINELLLLLCVWEKVGNGNYREREACSLKLLNVKDVLSGDRRRKTTINRAKDWLNF